MPSARLRILACLGLATLCACGELESPPPNVSATQAELRPDAPTPGEPSPLFASSDEVEHFDSEQGAFRIHFTRSGTHRVPATDANADEIPDYVEQVAQEYEAILAFYRDTLGFAPPLSDAFSSDNGGDGRFDVYLLDFATTADGSFRRGACLPDHPSRCTGYMVQENDFDRRNYPSLAQATRIVASHELFHALQAGYRGDAGPLLSEGSAVWASETYDPSLHDFEGFVGGYLAHPDYSLGTDVNAPVDPFNYGGALFFRFLEERVGRDIVRELWEALQGEQGEQADWIGVLDQTLREHDGGSLALRFEEFSRWNLYTAGRADPELAYQQGADYPAVTTSKLELPFIDEQVRVFPLAARFYNAPLGEAGELLMAASSPQPETLQGLRLLLARERAGRIVDVRSGDASAGPLAIATQNGDSSLHALLINTRLSGQSSRPALCIGTRAEIAACLPASTTERAPTPESDSGCHSAGGRSTTSELAWAVALCACALLSSRRTQRRLRSPR